MLIKYDAMATLGIKGLIRILCFFAIVWENFRNMLPSLIKKMVPILKEIEELSTLFLLFWEYLITKILPRCILIVAIIGLSVATGLLKQILWIVIGSSIYPAFPLSTVSVIKRCNSSLCFEEKWLVYLFSLLSLYDSICTSGTLETPPILTFNSPSFDMSLRHFTCA